jgi:hypothetical protein
MHFAGDAPGVGVYVCTRCGTTVSLGDDAALPPCSGCGNTTYTQNS